MRDQSILGILFGVGAGCIWAVEAILGKLLLGSSSFVQVTAIEAFFAALTALTYSIVRGECLRLDRKNVWNLLFVGLVGSVFAPLMYFFALTKTFAVNVTLIAHLQPLFVSILGFYFLKEILKKHDFVVIILIIFAAILTTSRTVDNLIKFKIGNYGDLTVLFATLSWAIVAIPGKRLTERISSITIVSYRFLVASAVFIPVLLYLDQLVVKSIYQILMGVLVGLGYIFYYEGLKRVKANQVALAELSSPFFTAILAWLFLGEVITLMQAIGAILMIIGLYILTGKNFRISKSRKTYDSVA